MWIMSKKIVEEMEFVFQIFLLTSKQQNQVWKLENSWTFIAMKKMPHTKFDQGQHYKANQWKNLHYQKFNK